MYRRRRRRIWQQLYGTFVVQVPADVWGRLQGLYLFTVCAFG